MIFEKIELHNFGIYRGSNTVDFCNDDGGNITLVGALNGRGKTTLLDAVFLTLYGKRAIPLIQDKPTKYTALLKSYINKSATDYTTSASVTLNLEDDGPTIITITRSWDSRDKNLSDDLVVLKDGIKDKYLSDNWNYYVEEIIPFGISRFFFFDNEKIAQIADDESFNEIKDSIKAVMGVNTIDKLLSDLQSVLKEKRAKEKAGTDSAAFADLKAVEDEIADIEGKIAAIRMERASITPKLERATLDVAEAEQMFWKIGGNLGLKREEIEQEKNRLVNEVNEIKDQQLGLAINPATPLCLCSKLVRQTYNTAKETEGKKYAQYSQPIVKDIIDSIQEKLDELNIDAVTRMRINLLLENERNKYESESDVCEENALAPASLLLLEKLINEGFFSIYDKKSELIKRMEENEEALQQIEAHLSNNAERGNATELLAKIRELDRTKSDYEHQLSNLDQQCESLEGQLEMLNNRRLRFIKKIAEIKNAGDDDQRVIAYTAKTIAVMEEFKLRLQMSKVKELEKNVTNCFKFLAQKETVITKVVIDPKTLDITLRGYNDGVLLKTQLSAGEKQMFAVAIIWGLALTSGYKLPVIIDTPMARLDSAHRYNFINKYLPNASAQVIVLSTDEEVYGQYLDQLRPHVGKYYTLVYDENNKCTSVVPGYFEEAVK